MPFNNRKDRLDYGLHLASARATIDLALTNSRTPIMTTKFTEDSIVLLHLVTQICPDIPVVWVDTGYNSRATLSYAAEIIDKLSLSMHTYRPRDHVITIPPELDSPEHESFVREVKLEPFGRALTELRPDAWFSSLRRYQSDHRSALPVFDVLANGILKISPMLEWSAASVSQYCDDHALPIGPPCYDPTKGEPLRECGLHLAATLPQLEVDKSHSSVA